LLGCTFQIGNKSNKKPLDLKMDKQKNKYSKQKSEDFEKGELYKGSKACNRLFFFFSHIDAELNRNFREQVKSLSFKTRIKEVH